MWPIWYTLRRIIKINPMGIFIYSIIAKWYIMILIASFVATFWVFKGLDQIGFVSYATKTVAEILTITKSIAKNCTPKLKNIEDLWQCLGNPGEYKDVNNDTKENNFKYGIESIIDKIVPVEHNELTRHPYENTGSDD